MLSLVLALVLPSLPAPGVSAAMLFDDADPLGRFEVERRTKACYCETGSQPAGQRAAFMAGCQLWFLSQPGCAIAETVDQDTDFLARGVPSGIKSLSIGYVGHWSGSWQLVSYLRRRIVPLLERGYSVSLENTACRGMNDPREVARFVASLRLRPGQRLDVKANQAISIGKWDTMLGSTPNFWAKVSSLRPGGVEYPVCSDYLGHPCVIQAQEGETALCGAEGATTRLRCCFSTPRHGGPQRTVWAQEGNCEPYRPVALQPSAY